MKAWFKLPIYIQIVIMMVLGVVAGALINAYAPEHAAAIKWIGDAFLKCIKMVIVPLVFASIAIGIAGVGDPQKLGRVGMRTVAFYLITTALAIAIGLVCVGIIKPGAGFDPEKTRALLAQNQDKAMASADRAKAKQPTITDTLLSFIPKNPLKSMAETEMIPVIFFAICVGLPLARMSGPNRDSIYYFLDGLQNVMILIIQGVMMLAPYGVFALITYTIGKFGLGILLLLLKYVITVILGLFLVVLLIYVPALKFLGGISPMKFFKGMKEALLIAFGTSSSSAALPVTMRNCQALGMQEDVVSFVCPLGATVNMAGTALYQGVAAMFIAQVFAKDLTIVQQLTIVFTATMAAVGAAAVPGIGIVTLAMVLTQVNLPVEGIALILGVDRILDMFRTVLNSMGDAVTCAYVNSAEAKRQEKLAAGDSAGAAPAPA